MSSSLVREYFIHYSNLMWHRELNVHDEDKEQRLLDDLDRCWFRMNESELLEVDDRLEMIAKSPALPVKYRYHLAALNQTESPLKAA